MDGEDYWYVTRDYPEAIRRREALERFLDALQAVITSGPEGEQEHYDKKGKRIKGDGRIEFIAYKRYIRQLLGEAGVIDAELEDLIDEIREMDEKMMKLERWFRASG